jgi:hypothetical protein
VIISAGKLVAPWDARVGAKVLTIAEFVISFAGSLNIEASNPIAASSFLASIRARVLLDSIAVVTSFLALMHKAIATDIELAVR